VFGPMRVEVGLLIRITLDQKLSLLAAHISSPSCIIWLNPSPPSAPANNGYDCVGLGIRSPDRFPPTDASGGAPATGMRIQWAAASPTVPPWLLVTLVDRKAVEDAVFHNGDCSQICGPYT